MVGRFLHHAWGSGNVSGCVVDLFLKPKAVEGKAVPVLSPRYVMQDDVLPGTSTVWEYLQFQARLRMPADAMRSQQERRVWHVLQQLRLTRVRGSLKEFKCKGLRVKCVDGRRDGPKPSCCYEF